MEPESVPQDLVHLAPADRDVRTGLWPSFSHLEMLATQGNANLLIAGEWSHCFHRPVNATRPSTCL